MSATPTPAPPAEAPSRALPRPIAAVFFDLDGTLADTAADLAAPINAMRIERGLDPLPLDELRPFASMGARGLIGRGLGVAKDEPGFNELRAEFLLRYETDMVVHTRLFDGMPDVLERLERSGVAWGVVSNKFERYVRIIVERLGLSARAAAIVGGDTTPWSKPHPEPLLHAARICRVDPRATVYVGDDLRDIVAGRDAGMWTVAAAYGFCGEEQPPRDWGADALIETPHELLTLLAD